MRPEGDPRAWGAKEWAAYNAYEKTLPVPPMFGPYTDKQDYYSSSEWLGIVTETLAGHRICLQTARNVNDARAIQWLSEQIRACETELQIAPAQGGLF